MRARSGRFPPLSSILLLGALTLVLSAPAHVGAFCGFYVGGAGAELYNEATLVVLMRDGTRTVLSMQNSYEGPPENFAMVVPVPVVLQQDDVHTLPSELFAKVDRLSAPRLVEYWEQDPCVPTPPVYPGSPRMRRSRANERARGGGADLGVRIEAEFAVAEYDIVVLSASDSSGLDTWLRREGYHIPEGAEPYLRPYVEQGTKFFVARVDTSRIERWEDGRAMLSPLRVQYDSEQFVLPVRLGLANSSGTQDLLVHILAREQRYEVANYDNVTVPTNLRVTDAVRESFGSFYASLFDSVLREHPNAVVTEYSWDSETCDPCPGPTLTSGDLMTLGADVIGGDPNNFTLTRLHYRYTADALGEDLVFRPAPGIVGGRGIPDAQAAFDRSVQPSSINNFQGRYAILHPFEGPVSCDDPRSGRWGGPPSGGAPRAAPATNLAFAPRAADLSSLVVGGAPAAALQGNAAPAEQPPGPGSAVETGSVAEPESDAGAESDASPGGDAAVSDVWDAYGKPAVRWALFVGLVILAIYLRWPRRKG